MVYPPYDYYARRDITVGFSVGYRANDGMYAQVVDDLGLVLGVDVDAARGDLMERPADTARRETWCDYVLTQEPGLDRAELDDLGRNDLIARVTKPAKKTAKTEPTTDSGA